MKRGNRSTANREREVKALAGVKSPPSNVNTPNEITVTKTGMLFSINELHCQEEFKKGKKSRSNTGKEKYTYRSNISRNCNS
jgi:hypothetical protein